MRGHSLYGKTHTVKEIERDLSKHREIADPKALAVSIRKKSLGKREFQRHVVSARKKVVKAASMKATTKTKRKPKTPESLKALGFRAR